MVKQITIGVLALQGAFAKHIKMLTSLGVNAVEVRKPEHLNPCSGLVIPGGESTALFNRIQFIEIADPIRNFGKAKPVFGTCAGLILMAKGIREETRYQPFGFLDLEVERNGYGRQAESFTSQLETYQPLTAKEVLKGVFIRAPRITSLGSGIRTLASFGGEPVIVQQGKHLGAACHPELTSNPVIHQYFLNMVNSYQLGLRGKTESDPLAVL